MRKLTLAGISLLFFSFLFIVSCKKSQFTPDLDVDENYELSENVKESVDHESTELNSATDYAISQNYLLEILNIVITEAILSPELFGFSSGDIAETRACPNTSVVGSEMTVTFGDINTGTPCSYIHSNGMESSSVQGEVKLLASNPDLILSGVTIQVRFDELIVGDKKIEFIGGLESERKLVVKFTGASAGGFTYDVKLDGQADVNNNDIADNGMNGEPPFDPLNRARFVFTCLSTGYKTIIYPTYSGGVVFNFEYSNGVANPILDLATFEMGCYSINIGATTAFYYDNTMTLIDDYRIIKDDNAPLLFKPTCKWIYGGNLIYDDIPLSDPNYTDGSNVMPTPIPNTDDPSRTIYYGIGAPPSNNNNTSNNDCDGWIRIESCDILQNGACIQGASTIDVECP